MRKTLRTYLVGLCIAVMTINPVLACCHSWGGGWGGGYYRGGPAYCGPVYSSGCCGGCYEVVVDDCCGCDSHGAVVHEGAPSGTLPGPPPMAPGEHSMQKSAKPAQPEQPAHVDRPVDDTPAPKLMPTPPTPPQPAQPAVPLPDDESIQPPPPTDNLFDSPPPMPPATEPAATPPATTPEAPPAKAAAPMDDLFGPPPAKSTEPAPAKEPAATPPATPPATAPATTDDLFGPPPETPAAPPEKPAEKTEEKTEEKDNKVDDIFGVSPNMLHEAGGFASNEMRRWVDNTGNFSCDGRLISFTDGQVRLMKNNGRTTTVPLARLSANDLRFVERQASAQQATVLQTAQAK